MRRNFTNVLGDSLLLFLQNTCNNKILLFQSSLVEFLIRKFLIRKFWPRNFKKLQNSITVNEGNFTNVLGDSSLFFLHKTNYVCVECHNKNQVDAWTAWAARGWGVLHNFRISNFDQKWLKKASKNTFLETILGKPYLAL